MPHNRHDQPPFGQGVNHGAARRHRIYGRLCNFTTLSLALYLAAIKRRQELVSNGSKSRGVLHAYTATLIDRYAEISAAGALSFYSLLVMSTYPKLVFTIPLVIFGLFRHWYIVEQLNQGESPTSVIPTDWALALTGLAWVGACVWMLWP